jgi:Fe-S cluster assembly iron-binding protein IscA
MFSITGKAAALLHETLAQNEKAESDVLRRAQPGTGLGLTLSAGRESDQVVEHEGRKALVIEPEIVQALDSDTIDAVDTPEGQSVVLQASERP